MTLRKIRESARLTQAQMGAIIGVSESYVKAIEIGQRPLSSEMQLRLRIYTEDDATAESLIDAEVERYRAELEAIRVRRSGMARADSN